MGASPSLYKSIYKLIENLSIFTLGVRMTNVVFFFFFSYSCIDLNDYSHVTLITVEKLNILCSQCQKELV